MQALAPAKLNLALHITGRRADGYHLLDSLVVFTDIGDQLGVSPAAELSLTVHGPMAMRLADTPAADNLVLRAAWALQHEAGVTAGAALVLEKHLPPASGIGGGSTDAAAALRLLAELWGVTDAPALARAAARIGADGPVCLLAKATRMSGIGEVLTPVPPIPAFGVVLINDGVPVPTGAVYAGLARRDLSPLPPLPKVWDQTGWIAWLGQSRNDLMPPALALTPGIATMLAALATTQPLFHRMSGSGGTCFGLYPDRETAERAAEWLRRRHPDWWIMAGQITE